MRPWPVLALLLAGCLGSPDARPGLPAPAEVAAAGIPDTDIVARQERAWTTVATPAGCAWFCEPTVAVDAQGRILVLGDSLALSMDGGASFEARSLPPVPLTAPPGSFQNDGLLQAGPDGRSYFSALITRYDPETQSLLLDGIQVASSPDAAATWDVDTYLSFKSTPRSMALGADRQWLYFGHPGQVFLGYQQLSAILIYEPTLAPYAALVPPPPGDIQVATSTDGGRSFGPFVNAVPAGQEGDTQIIGAGAVIDGMLLVPYHHYGDTQELVVARSEDGGASFTNVVAGPVGDFFPRLVRVGEGAAIVWKDVEDAVQVAVSGDGGRSWSAPTAWNAGNSTGSPWMEARPDGTLDVAWLQALGGGLYEVWHRAGPADDPGDATRLATLEAPDNARSYTDFLHFASLPDGRIAVVHSDTGAGTTSLTIG